MQNRQHTQGMLMVALSGILFGLMGYLGASLFQLQFSVANMLFWRFFTATIWILSWTFISNRRALRLAAQPSTLIKIFLLGAISYSGGSGLFFSACKEIGTGLAMVIFFSFPVFVTLFAWLFSGWRMNRYALFALSAVIIGLILLQDSRHTELNIMGISLALGSSFCYAAYVYGSQHTAKTIHPNLLTILVCSGNTLIYFCLAHYQHNFMVPTVLSAWLYILALGIFATALPIQLLLHGLKYISPIKASILSVLEPVVTVLIGIILLNETVTVIQAFGMGIILVGALLIQFEPTEEILVAI